MTSNILTTSFKYYGIATISGFIAVIPFAIIAVDCFPPIYFFYSQNIELSITLLTIVILIVGLLCLEFSISIEEWLDDKIKRSDPKIIEQYEEDASANRHIKNWYKYLLFSPSPDSSKIIFQHIDYLVERLKLVSSFLFALPMSLFGFAILNCIKQYLHLSVFLLFTVLAILLFIFLYNRAYTISKYLSYLRKILIDDTFNRNIN
jgi:hypothetical protein